MVALALEEEMTRTTARAWLIGILFAAHAICWAALIVYYLHWRKK